MNKKLMYVLMAILLVAVVAFAACNRGGTDNDPDKDQDQNQDQTQDKSILDLYDDVKNAKKATQTITIKKGADEIAVEKLSYNFETGKVTIERKMLNSSDADELYTTTTETKDIEGRNTANLTAANLKDVTETQTKLTAKVANANLNTVFGIASTDVKGDAVLELVAQGSHIVSITVTYTDSADNAVQIVTNYVY